MNTKQEREIRIPLLKVFLPIIAIIIPIVYFQENNLDRVKKRYEKTRDEEYSGKVIKKKEDGDYPRASRYVFLENYRKIHVSNSLYANMAIGDSVSKIKGSDSIYFYLKNGEIVIKDVNKSKREDYENLINKKRKE
ncbi:hypothetical protein [Flavivirga jejuensis]|uniref:Uncharacterized protein n=1 Tax=Flavivirga jejuensis TaxID=870487 RepID=A0ABT8WIF4_9FLAO|nr:hypothetical protein [Flavivirga jejuensis]MDO5972907.1 hypothetical protein [Flavivirga jejuensis]